MFGRFFIALFLFMIMIQLDRQGLQFDRQITRIATAIETVCQK